MPKVSEHFASLKPSAIRRAQIEFEKRTDGVKAINVAIGNVTLPMHPAMQERMFHLNSEISPFKDGVVGYTTTAGTPEANAAMKNVLKASGVNVENLFTHITSGGSEAMEYVILGVCEKDRPLLVIDPIYTNYHSLTKRVGLPIISYPRGLNENGDFETIDLIKLEELIKSTNPGALLVIPYDNPTGAHMGLSTLRELAALCIKHDMWFVSDEAYRELHYGDKELSSVWAILESDVPGIVGRRVSIESASKVYNACGLRIGAIVTDNEEFHTQAVAEHTTNLCASAISQYIFAALAEENVEGLQAWFKAQRAHYEELIKTTVEGLKEQDEKLIVSSPEAALYSVVDVRNLVTEYFDSADFSLFCAQEGFAMLDDGEYTLLISPMSGFYTDGNYEVNPGRTQLRIAYVQDEQTMKKVPELFYRLLKQYLLED
ncbi:aminotransferase class I/II-fold pyridoxal phosphate-dependent enzyme [candidate division WWE3 bacterium]|uniref:Aminotransferase n=1 Tax=candidate division WWE3 bacterium TaxID=2053526 RepID=A0A955RQS2_UNCKA|nr:aminotransferase class I/II-fold pyridoxal phosphate-dependent enzyme [candidate division WWE3 bacterium]